MRKHSIQSHLVSGKNKQNYKTKEHVPGLVDDDRGIDAGQLKVQNRCHARDKKREGKKRTLMELAAAQSIGEDEIPISTPIPISVEAERIVPTLEGLELEDFNTLHL